MPFSVGHYEPQTHYWLWHDLLDGEDAALVLARTALLQKKKSNRRKQALISVWIASAQEWNRYNSSLKASSFLFGTRATGVCETHKCTHTSCLPSQTHIDSRDYNYRHSHNVASRYAASVIASPVATWQQRSLATATARHAASGPASLQYSHIWICMSGDQARCRQKTLAGVFSLLCSDSYQC